MRSAIGAIAAIALLSACGQDAPVATGEPADTAAEPVIDERIVEISADELAAQIAAGEVNLIDVRSAEEFAEGHIAGAVNLPVDTFSPSEIPASAGETILYCRSDRRSGIAARQLADYTGETVRHLDGGIVAWQEAGRPVTTATD